MTTTNNDPDSSMTSDCVPLPTGEHPWAAGLRFWRRLLSTCELAVTLALTAWLLISQKAVEWANLSQTRLATPWTQALAYGAGLAAVYAVLGMPFGFVRSQLLEKRFGLSTQSSGAWAIDQVKGLCLGGLLGAIVVLGLTACLLFGGQNWWVSASIGAAVFGVILTRLAPQLLIPVFFKMKPLENTALVERFRALARKTETPVLGIFEIDLSRRTRAANAAVVGFGASRRALVGDTLLARFSDEEIEFVLAHELGHHHYHDLWVGIAAGSALATAGFFLTHLLIAEKLAAGFNPVLLFWIAVLTQVFGTALSPVSRFLSRRMETRADAFAAAATNRPEQGAAAFRKLGFQNLAVFQPPAWEEALLYTHPAIARRIARLNRT